MLLQLHPHQQEGFTERRKFAVPSNIQRIKLVVL